MLAQENNDKISGELQNVVNDAEELMKSTSAQTGERIKEIRARLASAIESAKDATRRMQEKAKDAAKATDQSVRAHPYEFIGAAVGVGLVLGFLLGRRR